MTLIFRDIACCPILASCILLITPYRTLVGSIKGLGQLHSLKALIPVLLLWTTKTFAAVKGKNGEQSQVRMTQDKDTLNATKKHDRLGNLNIINVCFLD